MRFAVEVAQDVGLCAGFGGAETVGCGVDEVDVAGGDFFVPFLGAEFGGPRFRSPVGCGGEGSRLGGLERWDRDVLSW